MSWLLSCICSRATEESPGADERSCANTAAKSATHSKAATGNSLSACLTASLDQGKDPSSPQLLLHAPSSRVRKASQLGLRHSEETLASALSTTPTSLNPLAYVFPFTCDDNEEFSTGNMREGVDAPGSNAPPGQPRSKVEFADLCGSLEDLVYIGEGSNGVVYTASWHGARVAVKFLLGSNDDGTYLQRCLTEAVLTRVLSHPCVVQCFATATSQLTPEVWDSIRARCRRHRSLLQSCSLGRSVAAAVQQQEHQERTSMDLWEQQLQQQLQHQLHQQQLQQLPGDRRQSFQHLRSQSSLQGSRHSPRHTPPEHPRLTPQHQQQPQPQPPPSLSQPHSQMQVLLLPSSDRLSPSPPPPGVHRGPPPGCNSSTSEQALLDLQKMTAFFAEDLNRAPHLHPQHAQHQLLGPQQQQQSGGVGSSLELSGDEAMVFGSGGVCGGGGGGPEGISLMQALLDLKAEAGRHCTLVVMEYLDAGTLHQAISRRDFSARRASEHRTQLLALLLTAQELSQGMAHLHGLDILHGDLKPTNVLLKAGPSSHQFTDGRGGGGGGGGGPPCSDPRGYSAKIADLGLARPCSGGTAELASDQWGALAYLAPEAAKGSCCKASDVYSFGVMLWEMSAGVRPYLGLTTPQVLMGLVTGQLQLTWPADGSLYGPLRSLAIACTDFNPAERPTFEVAARILGRMVRHIKSASEPLRQRHSSALSFEAATTASRSCGGGGGGGGGGPCGGGGGDVGSCGGGGGAGGIIAGAGSIWAAKSQGCVPPPPPQQLPQPAYPYPRTRRAAGGGVCGGVVVRSPLGVDVAGGRGSGNASVTAGSRAPPSAPGGDPRVSGQPPPQALAAARAAFRRPESSPAHPHVAEEASRG